MKEPQDLLAQDSEHRSKPDNAGVKLPPPLIMIGFLAAGLAIQSGWREGELAPLAAMLGGGVLAFLGLGLILTCAFAHRRVGTNIEPWEPTTVIVTTGLYGRSRNPIYLGMVLLHIGVAVAAGSVTGCFSVFGCIFVLQSYVIAREERYLEDKFGKAYTDYRSRVRRWI